MNSPTSSLFLPDRPQFNGTRQPSSGSLPFQRWRHRQHKNYPDQRRLYEFAPPLLRNPTLATEFLVDTDAGVLAGHARLCAARSLHLEMVPVIVLDHLTAMQKRAYILADNQLALQAGWDDTLLGEELMRLKEEHFPIETIGFDDDQLAALLNEHQQPSEMDPDATPEPLGVPVTQPGDTWLLGPHRVHCGDATLPASLDAVLAGESAHMVFTDPPYNVNYSSAGRQIANDNLGDGFAPFLFRACTNLLAVTTGGIYICMSSSELHTLHHAFTSAGGHWSTFLIWSKNRFTLGRSDYQRQYEPILYGWKEGGNHYWCGDRDQSDVWSIDRPSVNDLHPTMKPVELVERAIHNSSRTGQVVLDPFGGSGSTLIACERTGRRARIMELAPCYVDVIVRRWQESTGKVATREADGRSFQEVAAPLIQPTGCDLGTSNAWPVRTQSS